ncbi:aminodeoxychorismate lyase [Actinophytocola oryzae]|uniref:4-amino-4-deoxychorismate lyase n=1 Tax=Actinophytocola oryzae TaxID=502181 RepID=A0A4R7UVQ6_9PSEU|nr:aminodeoxychorismate lyase [Actinophytocola oryzae]TDV40032.1 4-amino-4-deoxychorismate lyase [Actinophytocola oryzae]
MRVLVMLDGTVVDPGTPVIRVDDLGITRGDGVFETILVVDGKPRELGPHLDRLDRSAAMLQLPPPSRPDWEHCVQAVLDNWRGGAEMALKMIYTRGPEFGDGTPTGYAMGLEIGEKVLRARQTGVAAITLDRGYDPEIVSRAPWLLLGAKSLSYAVNMAATRHAESVGASEVIFIAADGSVLEGPTSSVVLVNGRTLRTTPPSSGILKGTTQGALFRAAERAGWVTKVEPVTLAELREADALFMASSVRKITRVHTLDGTALADTTDLREELNALYESEY